MKIALDGSFKSLTSFQSEELHEFTVITGKNGCGKSQLLELIKLSSERNLPKDVQINVTPNQSNIQVEGIASDSLSSMSHSNWKRRIDQIWNVYIKYSESYLTLLEYLFQIERTLSYTEESIVSIVGNGYLEQEELIKLLQSIMQEIIRYEYPVNKIPLKKISEDVMGYIQRDSDYHEAFKFVSDYRGKKVGQLQQIDFLQSPLPEKFLSTTSVFHSNLDQLFYAWANRREKNHRLYFDKKELGDENNSIPDSEFVETFPPPWKMLNQIFSDNDINYHFDGVERQDFSPDVNIEFNLINNDTEARVPLSMLSSGEQTIFGLIIKLFIASYFGKDKPQFPDLLILDEPDAHLHPELSKLLVDILHKTFVRKYGMKIIMVTHSPSTVALSPDESIYELKNHPKTELKKISKEEALNILTSRLPTLSIDYQNHKQVFVESPTDVNYYQTIFNKISENEGTPFRLYFISNAMGRGNCDQVYKIVSDIRESGNKTSFGIVDWDCSNRAQDFVLVHGENSRYNVENFVCDPIFIVTHLISLNANNVLSELKKDNGFNEYSVCDFSDSELQEYVDWFFEKYYLVHKTISVTDREDVVEWKYLNGKSVKVPKWYSIFPGHDLIDRIKKVFSALEHRYTSEGSLQKALVTTMAKCYPLVPKDSVELINELLKR